MKLNEMREVKKLHKYSKCELLQLITNGKKGEYYDS